MKIRPLRREDLVKIDDIYRQHHQQEFSLPALSNTVTHAVIEDDEGNIVGFGVVKLLAEAVMVLDLNKPKIDRLEAMELLMHEALRGCEEASLEQLHVFVKDPRLERLLERRYAFQKAQGVALVREL